MFEIRRVKPTDKAEILAICKKIWEGDDYIPLIFDSWVSDKQGEFTAVLYEGKIVGMGKLTYLTETDVWLEGLRADPQSPVHGIGKAITVYYQKKLSRKKNITSIRFSTYYANGQSRKLSENAGFRVLHKMSNKYYNIWKREKERLQKKIAKAEGKVKIKEPVTLAELGTFIERSEYLKLAKNFLFLSWTAYPYSREVLKKIFYSPEQYHLVRREGKIAGLVLYDVVISERNYTTISFFEAADLEVARELFEYVKIESARRGFWHIETKVPTRSAYMEFATRLKMKSWEIEDDFLIYELPLSNV